MVSQVYSYMFKEILLRTSNLQKFFLLNWYGGRFGINFHKFCKQYLLIQLIVLSQDWTVSKSDDKITPLFTFRGTFAIHFQVKVSDGSASAASPDTA